MLGPCLAVAAAAGFSLPLTAAVAGPDIATTLKAAIAAVFLGSALWPPVGLLAVGVVVPFSVFVQVSVGGQPAAIEIADAFVLAFAAGASLRLARPSPSRPTRLGGPAMVLAAAVVASAVAELATLQAVAPRAPMLADAWRHVTVDYWLHPRELSVVHHAWRWAGWLALAVYAERIVAASRAPVIAFRAWMVIGLLGGLAAATHLVRLAMAGGAGPLMTIREALPVLRFSALHPDLNAAGSYFALFLVPAIVVGVWRGTWWIRGIAAPLIGAAFFFARSRAAMAAVLLVMGGAYARHLVQSNARVRRLATPSSGVVAIGLVVLAVLAVTYVATSRSNVAPLTAVEVRVQMAKVAFEAVRRQPIFGVGLGDYIPGTRRFITPDMTLLRGFAPRGDNAHNNFLQLAVELGVPALAIFLWLVVPVATVGIGRTSTDLSPEATGMSLGIAAFLLSAMLGHPLLVPQVGAMFFLALGVGAGLGPAPHAGRGRGTLVGAGVSLYLLSAVWRLV